jgi:hypothetical protein
LVGRGFIPGNQCPQIVSLKINQRGEAALKPRQPNTLNAAIAIVLAWFNAPTAISL